MSLLADATHADTIWTAMEQARKMDSTPPCHLSIILEQRARWHANPEICPRCGAIDYKGGSGHIIDNGVAGICCTFCEAEA